MGYVVEAEPILMVSPPSLSDWVIRKAAEVGKCMGISLKGMEQKLEELL